VHKLLNHLAYHQSASANKFRGTRLQIHKQHEYKEQTFNTCQTLTVKT